MFYARTVTVNLPGVTRITLERNDAARRAAWILYVEISTRVASQPFDREHGSIRAALSSLHSLFEATRGALRDAGPRVGAGDNSAGVFLIRFLGEVIAPFLTKWHEQLAHHETIRPANMSKLEHERAWEQFEICCEELRYLQASVEEYLFELRKLI